jgi:hypothetical protein
MLAVPSCQLLYPFENQANDYSGNARHGTVNGSGVFATRPSDGRCLYFDGVGDYVATPNFGLSGTVVVFAANVRCKDQSFTQRFLSSEQNIAIGYILVSRYHADNKLQWQYANGSLVAVDFLNYFDSPFNDAWVHVCVVCDYSGKITYAFRNGIPYGAPVAMLGTPLFPSTSQVYAIGQYVTGGELLTDGYLQNVYLGTLLTCPSVAALTANANRLMLGMHPIF